MQSFILYRFEIYSASEAKITRKVQRQSCTVLLQSETVLYKSFHVVMSFCAQELGQ